MAKGKQTCKILKEIRKQIAEENDIELVVSECTYQGDCLGTCPKCEAEVRYLERELEKRQRLGKAAVFAGMSIGTMLAASACGLTADAAKTTPNCSNGTEVTQPDKPLAGDVVATAPERPETDTIIEEPPLMGIFPIYRNMYAFDAETYQSLLKELFVYPKMENLSVISGKIEYENVRRENTCESLEELVKAAKEFMAPYYGDGEQQMSDDLAIRLKVDASKYNGDMEIAFTVAPWGEVQDVEIVKGLNKVLDDAVVDAFKQMDWYPAEYQLKDEADSRSFACRCVQKIHFPIK